MKITVETAVKAPLERVWQAWNNPEDIKRWNAASADWHMQRRGWQAILDNFARHVEGGRS